MIKHGTTKEFFQKIQADIKKQWKVEQQSFFDLINTYLFEFSYNKAIQLNPMNDEVWYNKGVLLNNLGRY